MRSYSLGIDVGTSGVRAAVIDENANVLAFASTRFSALGGDPRAPATWRRALEATLRRLGIDCDLTRIAALAVDGTSGTMIAIDGDGEPIGPARMYDEPCDDPAVLARIEANAPPGSAALGSTSALARVLLMQDRPGVAKVIHQADWLTGILSGRFDRTDENNALKTGYDPILRQWPDWIARAGAQIAKLPQVSQPGTPVGDAGAFAQRIGLTARTRVCAGTTDGCASFLATGACEIGDAVTALGSTLVIKLLCDAPVNAPEYGVYSHRLGERWLAGGASNTGGKVIESLFPGEDLEALSAALRPEEPTRLHLYPLARPGERFPINDPALPPRLTPRPPERARFFQAVLEGIAEIEALAYRRLEELGAPPIRSVRSIGGGAANRGWTQIRRGLMTAPFATALSQEACVGTALLARRPGFGA